jgi:hypothetical protein
VPGPAPKHPSIRARRNDMKKGFRVLAGQKRPGSAPAWPLRPDVNLSSQLEVARDRVAELQVKVEEETDGRKKGRLRRELNKNEMLVAKLTLQLEQATDAEVSVWRELWKLPQAVIWKETGANREVAQYVRWKVRAEQGDLKAATEARLLSDRLGLNPLALLRLRAEVEHVDDVEAKGRQRRTTAPAKAKTEGKSDGKGKGDDDPRGGLYAVS